MVECSRHGRNRIAEGSATIRINRQPAARRGDHTECGAVIMAGAKSIILGGPSVQVLPIRPEVPRWLHNGLVAVAIGGTLIATGGAAMVFWIGAAAGGLIGSLAGGWSLGWIGGKVGHAMGEHFGTPELGERIGQVSLGVVGSLAGGSMGARFGAKVLPASAVPEGGIGSSGVTPGTIDESGRTFTPEEGKIASKLAAEGKDVKALPENNPTGVRNPDALVDGKPTEFKTPAPGANSNTIKNEVSSSIRGTGQARNIVIDAENSGLTQVEAERALNRIAGIQNGKLDSVRIIGKGFDLNRNYP